VPDPVSRRTFLAASAGLLVAAACSGGDDDDSASSTSRATTPEPDTLSVLIGSAQVIAGVEQRVSFGVFRDNEPFPGDQPLSVHIGKDFSSLDRSGVIATYHEDGIEERPYWTATLKFDAPGEHAMAAVAGDLTGGAGVNVLDPASVKVPQRGQKMVPVATPTTADARGVNPICTRQPACPLHEVSLDAALAEGRPLVAIFSTPALCQSRICGPVLDILLDEMAAYADRVRFLHVEVYKSLDADLTAASLTDGMRAYNLTFEPVLFFAGADGTIRQQVDGPFDRGEMRGWLAELVS
jgi:hypothetical protein